MPKPPVLLPKAGAIEEKRARATLLLLWVILVVGASLRLWGVGFGLPNILCRPDETTLVNKALSIGAGDLNPHFFNYPSLQFYLLTALYGAYWLVGYAFGCFAGLADFQRQFFVDPSPFFLLGRLFNVVLGTASIYLTYLLGCGLGGRRTGLLGALFLSVSFLHVRDSHFLTVDVPAVFFLLVGLVIVWRYLDRGDWGSILLGAFFVGLSASTKYNLALWAPALGLAALLMPNARAERGKRLFGAFGIMGLAFLAGSPFIALDFSTFWRDLSFERAHFATGHGQDLGIGWFYHLRFSLYYGVGWPLLGLGLAGCVFAARQRNPRGLVLLCGVLTYYVVAGSGRGVFMRYALPLVPPLCILAGDLVAKAISKNRWGIGLIVLAAASPAWASWQHDKLLSREDTRVQAASWIEAVVPAGSAIAMVGSDYGYPQLRPTATWLEERLEDVRASGLAGRRIEQLLQYGDLPMEPTYYIVELRAQSSTKFSSIWSTYSLKRLRDYGVEWVITQDHPLPYSQLDPLLEDQLAQKATLVRRFDPFKDRSAGPIFDRIDAYYVPVSGFSGVERPGPLLNVYRLKADVE